MTVIKRDGTKVPFSRSKIVNAVDLANRRTSKKDKNLGVLVGNEVEQLLSKGENSVTKIEDLVEKTLKETSRETHKEYSTYRKKRQDYRFKGSDIANQAYSILLEDRNERENSNMDESTFSGRSSKIAATLNEQFARTYLISADVLEAHDKGLLHQHDIASFALGNSNCLMTDISDLLKGGVKLKNGGTREPKSIRVALAQTYLFIGAISQSQYGGCSVASADSALAPYLRKTFYDHFKKTCKLFEKEVPTLKTHWEKIDETLPKDMQKIQELSREYALDDLAQGMKGFFHDLSGSSAREGSQLSFSSINFGCAPDPDAVLIAKSFIETRAGGIGSNREIPIFPISIFQTNLNLLHGEGKPLEWLFNMAIESTSKNVYPNYIHVPDEYVFGDWRAKPTTMGCRSANGVDRFSEKLDRTGRGNIAPVTLSLPYLALKAKGDITKFKEELQKGLMLVEKALLERYAYQCKQKGKNAPFLYENGAVKSDTPIGPEDSVEPALKHGSLVFGYIGLAEALVALTGKHHGESEEAHGLGLEITTLMSEYALNAGDRNNLNLFLYATPSEGLCLKARNKAAKEFGIVKGVTEREYFTNSHHIPVYYPITASEKIQKEKPFSALATAGTILYVELTGDAIDNPQAVKELVTEAMENEIQYFAVNVPRDTCNKCGYKHYDLVKCPKCGSNEIKQLRRITGYTTSEVKHMNDGKQAEVRDRVKHLSFNNLESLL